MKLFNMGKKEGLIIPQEVNDEFELVENLSIKENKKPEMPLFLRKE